MQVGGSEWVERPGSEPLAFLFGSDESGKSAAVVVRGVRPTVEVLCAKNVSDELGREFAEILKKHQPRIHYDGEVICLSFASLDGARAAEGACARAASKFPAHLVSALGESFKTRERRTEPAAWAMTHAGISSGDWVCVPPRHAGIPLLTTCSSEGCTYLKDLRALKERARPEHAPRRVIAIKSTSWGSFKVAADVGNQDSDVFKLPGDLCQYVKRVDPDIIIVQSKHELAILAQKVPCGALGRIRMSLPDSPVSGRVVIEFGDAKTVDSMLASVMAKGGEHFIRTRNRPCVSVEMTDAERVARVKRFEAEEKCALEAAKQCTSLVEAFQTIKQSDCEMWRDPLNNSLHPVFSFRGKRVFHFTIE